MILILLFFFACYCIWLTALIIGFNRIIVFSEEIATSKTGFSVIIPVRNEAENLPNLLKTIDQLNYPSALFEVIFVNDASEDSSEECIQNAIEDSVFTIKVIQNKRLSNAPKKDAISEAIKKSSFEWIITSDADCELPKHWLKTLDSFIQSHNPVMVCAPVIYKTEGSILQNFQHLDGLSLQAVTIGSFGLKNPLLSNGANLAYSKGAFYQVKGFTGNDHLASGDDVFLLEKMKREFPKKVLFLKAIDSIVATKPQQTWQAVINQRVRWTSKTSKQKNAASILLGLLVFIVNVSILMVPLLLVLDFENIVLYLLILFLKISVDYFTLKTAAQFFNVKITFWKLIPQTYIYAVITILVLLGSLSCSYTWKGRTLK